jgi:hypothetical protein
MWFQDSKNVGSLSGLYLLQGYVSVNRVNDIIDPVTCLEGQRTTFRFCHVSKVHSNYKTSLCYPVLWGDHIHTNILHKVSPIYCCNSINPWALSFPSPFLISQSDSFNKAPKQVAHIKPINQFSNEKIVCKYLKCLCKSHKAAVRMSTLYREYCERHANFMSTLHWPYHKTCNVNPWRQN